MTKQLEKETHRTLRVLSKDVQEEDVRAFVEKAGKMTEPGDRTEPLPAKAGRFGLLLKQPKVVASSLISFST